MDQYNKILTVSIAAYQVENTIDKCLVSFLTSKNLPSLELLIINDGSKDRTAEVVTKYVEQYPSIIKLVNKENGGHGSTINKSLSIAKGKFFKILDGDDWIDADELDKLVDFLKNTQAELVIDRYREVYSDHTRIMGDVSVYDYSKVYNFSELFPDGNIRKKLFAMHQITILTERLRDVKMYIMEKCFYADTMYMYYVGLSARTVAFCTSCAYQYRLGVEGQSVSGLGVYKHIEDMLKIEYELIEMYARDSKKKLEIKRKDYLFAIIDTRYNMIYNWYIDLIPYDDKDKILLDFIKKINSNYTEILSKFHLSKRNKLAILYPAILVPMLRRIEKSKLGELLHGR